MTTTIQQVMGPNFRFMCGSDNRKECGAAEDDRCSFCPLSKSTLQEQLLAMPTALAFSLTFHVISYMEKRATLNADKLAVLRDYVQRSTHWQEGGADRHAALQALQQLEKQAMKATDV